MKTITTILSLLIALSSFANAQTDKYLVKAYAEKCNSGLYKQPRDGPFTVFLFCDGALGANIGVINERTPGLWEKWDPSDRFWQDGIWCTDINSFAWSPDLRYLYVATSYIYGNGGFYRLDLIHRKATRLIPSEITPYFTETKHAYETEIRRIDLDSGQVEVTFDFFNARTNAREKRNIIIK